MASRSKSCRGTRCAPRKFRIRKVFRPKLIAGLDRPTSGSVVVGDRDLASLSREDLAKYRLRVVGMVFQSFNLIASMTLTENVELPLRFAEVDRGQRQGFAREALSASASAPA